MLTEGQIGIKRWLLQGDRWMTVYDKALANLIKLAKTPGWKEYAWHRAKELEQCETGMWHGIAEDLKRHMLAKQSSPARPKSGE